ncbi:geranylgeranyl transferase type-1 subunit beta [Microsporum audouinii]
MELRKDRQIKYFLRCLKTLLPHPYTSNDSNRMTLAYFTLAGLDLLGALDGADEEKAAISAAERAGYINWLYHCQVSTGGFRGFTGANFGEEKRAKENECWDPANVPATFFALVALLILEDDLARVRRRECLSWLCSMQREDGSFGQTLGPGDSIDGGRDLRFCCCAAGIRYILKGEENEGDINAKRLIDYVQACQTYEGGFAESPFNESNAGLTYCALGTLSFLGCLQPEKKLTSSVTLRGSTENERLISWLVFRQTTFIEQEEEDNDVTGDNNRVTEAQGQEPPGTPLDDAIASLPALEADSQSTSLYAGFNGRPNKIADTCYCFWVTGSLAMLDRLSLVDSQANRRYLLEKTQHMIGGFGKTSGEPPDLLHSYLGLASLGLFGEQGLDAVDPMLCASRRVRRHLDSLSWKQT